MPELRDGKSHGNCRAELKMGNVRLQRSEERGNGLVSQAQPCTYVRMYYNIATIDACVTYGVRGMVGVHLRPLPHE